MQDSLRDEFAFFWKNCTKLHTQWRVIPNRSLDLSKKVLVIKIAFSFIPLIPCLVLPRELRETTEGTPKEDLMSKKALFLRLSPKKLTPILKKLTLFLKPFTYLFKEKITSKGDFSCSIQNISLPLQKYFNYLLPWGHYLYYYFG